jgi:hypothetical protein
MPSTGNHARKRTDGNQLSPADHEKYFRDLCKRCYSNRLGDSGNGDIVCFSCGLVAGRVFADSPEFECFRAKTYKRVFYFNERCSRWLCSEPKICADAWNVIYKAAKKYIKRNTVNEFTRRDVSKILRSVKLTNTFMEKHRSKKFKKTKMSKKRFYDKYSEKWKTIIWKLSGKMPILPSKKLVDMMKHLFAACQKPWDIFRHVSNCDKRHNCDLYFDCWHNFINYDFIFRKLLQICELKFGFKDVYDLHKQEFPNVSKKIRDEKLRPMFKKIANYNQWPCPDDED